MALRALYGLNHQVHIPLRSFDGQNRLSDNSSIIVRWSMNTQSLFSVIRNVQNAAIH